jgi:M6 family metalloprotease-like protein
VCLCAFVSLAAALPASAGRQVPAYRTAQKPAPARPGARVADAALNTYQRARLQSLGTATFAVREDTLRVIAFQVQFQDSLMGGEPGSNRAAVRDSLWFSNELEHTAQYFRGASRGHFQMPWTLADTLYTLPNRMNYYGSDTFEETRVVELAQSVVAFADGAVDFSQYDHVFIIHAGAGQETDVVGDSPIQIWSSFYDLGDIRAALDDETAGGLATSDSLAGVPFFVDNFSIVPSDASQDLVTIGTLGIWAFQIGSRIGLVPMFDSTPGGAPDSQGVGGFCLMGYGLFNVNGFAPGFPCAFNRLIAGWLDPVVIDPDAAPATVRLTDVNTGADTDTVCVKVPITESEYYLVVNRVHDANFDSLFTFADDDLDLIPDNDESLDGAEFDFFLTDLTNPAVRRYDPVYGQDVLRRHTGSGVYIWHVDERVVEDAVRNGYLPDDFVARKGVDLEEADGVQDMDRLGAAAFSLGSFNDSYRTGDGNASLFGPGTKPASVSNAGVATGITIETLSPPGLTMRVDIRRDAAFTDARRRWRAASPSQPATLVDLDGDGAAEIVGLSDDAGVFVFTGAGLEWVDGDLDPATIDPFIAVPGASWTGPPAFANLDGGADTEIVAIARDGAVYAWKANGAELVDGDADPGTVGVLFSGAPMAAPPMLVDVDGDAVPEVAIAERVGDSIRVSFVNAGGAVTAPSAPEIAPLWPLSLPAQRAAAFALSRVTDGGTETSGLVAACVDSLTSRAYATWLPVSYTGAAPADAPQVWTAPLGSGGDAGRLMPSAPAVGDIDGDGDDEVVVAVANGSVVVLDPASAHATDVRRESGTLRAAWPSDPVLGDVDGDGTLEIALWDSEYMYILKSNARTMIEWPVVIRPESAGEAPAITPRREMESALVADIDANGAADVLFPLDDGTVVAVTAAGAGVRSFPRVGPSEMGAAPTLGLSAPGSWSLVSLGSNALFADLDAVSDSLASEYETTLSIQSLDGAVQEPAWAMARADLARSGRAAAAAAPATSTSAYDPESFIIYPNPVQGDEVRARLDTHAAARIEVSVFTVEGQVAVERSFEVNPNGLVNTPFDEAINVAALKSGVYLLRLKVDAASGGGSLVKPFAIRR